MSNKHFGIPDYKAIFDEGLLKYKEGEGQEEQEENFDDELTEEEIQEFEEMEREAQNDFITSVTFTLTKEGDIDISTQWIEMPQFTKVIAQFLYFVHVGNAKMTHLQFFDNYIKGHPESFEFLKKVVHEWSKLEKDERPVVKPHNALRIHTGHFNPEEEM